MYAGNAGAISGACLHGCSPQERRMPEMQEQFPARASTVAVPKERRMPEMQEQFSAGASMVAVPKNEGCRKCRSNFRRVPRWLQSPRTKDAGNAGAISGACLGDIRPKERSPAAENAGAFFGGCLHVCSPQERRMPEMQEQFPASASMAAIPQSENSVAIAAAEKTLRKPAHFPQPKANFGRDETGPYAGNATVT